jgi:hypothetical protein
MSLNFPRPILPLVQSYGKQLSHFKSVLIEDFDWDDEKPAGYAEDFLGTLSAAILVGENLYALVVSRRMRS